MNTEPKKYIFHVEPAIAAITPYGMATISEDLFKMASYFENDNKISLAQYYIYCASMEIGLKAAILARDCTKESKETIKNFGHNLHTVKNKFEDLYDPIWDKDDIKAIEKINPFFKDKDLEYFKINVMGEMLKGLKQFPSLDSIENAARKVNQFVNQEKFFINAKTSQKPGKGFINFV